VVDYIAADDSINEVIFSGGDPLLSPDRTLSRLVQELEAVEHLQRLRIHTRLPVVIPQRVDDELLQWLRSTRFQTVMVLHINHSAEIDTTLAARVADLKASGVTVLNQSVLLRGVNDSVDTLVELSEALFAAGILPYYLHVLDKTAGTAHFDCSETEARRLFAGMQMRLSGFLVPKLVREIPERASKTLIF
ncbi:MAG: KamA family radical SAM protein, partial [Pseudomonadota bacterium]